MHSRNKRTQQARIRRAVHFIKRVRRNDKRWLGGRERTHRGTEMQKGPDAATREKARYVENFFFLSRSANPFLQVR